MKTVILCGKGGRSSIIKIFSEMLNKDAILAIRKQKKDNTFYYDIFKKDETDLKNLIKSSTKKITSLLEDSILIKWGNRINVDQFAKVVYNNSDSVKNASVKNIARNLFTENGVLCPLNITDKTPENQINYPIIGRPLIHHQGQFFLTFNTRKEFLAHYKKNNSDHYYSNFVDKVREFRAHVASNKILALLEKPKPEDPNMIAWNHAQNGDAWNVVNWSNYGGGEKENDLRLVQAAIKAVVAINIDFGAVDIIVDANGDAYVLEVNTSPELTESEYSAARYACYFDWLGKYESTDMSNLKRPNWDSLNYIKAKSFSWKAINFELNE